MMINGASCRAAEPLVAAFGGVQNIKGLDACITRLRLELHDNARANPDALKALGYQVEWHEYPMPHSVCPEQVDDIGAWLRQVLG